MRKKLLVALLLCAIMVSTMAVTTVSAKQAGKSDIRQYDIVSSRPDNDGNLVNVVFGKLTLNVETGHYTFSFNIARVDAWAKSQGTSQDDKELYKKSADTYEKTYFQVTETVVLINYDTYRWVCLGTVAVLNNGGNVIGEGTVPDTVLPTIQAWDAHDYVWVDLMMGLGPRERLP